MVFQFHVLRAGANFLGPTFFHFPGVENSVTKDNRKLIVF